MFGSTACAGDRDGTAQSQVPPGVIGHTGETGRLRTAVERSQAECLRLAVAPREIVARDQVHRRVDEIVRTPVTRDRFALGVLDRFAVPALEGTADLQVHQINVVLIVEVGDRVGVVGRTEGVGRGAGLDLAVVPSPPLGPPAVGP